MFNIFQFVWENGDVYYIISDSKDNAKYYYQNNIGYLDKDCCHISILYEMQSKKKHTYFQNDIIFYKDSYRHKINKSFYQICREAKVTCLINYKIN